MEVSELRKEISKCKEFAVLSGNIEHAIKYKNDIETIDNMMLNYFGKVYNDYAKSYE